MTEEEREAAAIAKLMPAMGTTGDDNGGSQPKLKRCIKKAMMARQFTSGYEHRTDNRTTLDDSDLAPPNVVLDLWCTVADEFLSDTGELLLCTIVSIPLYMFV